VVVLGAPEVLHSLGQIPVIPISTQVRGLSWEVPLSEADGLPSPCVLKPEWVQTVDRGLLGPWIADFPARRWPELRAALFRALGLAGES
jgi:mRNA-degrading endonuclease toxin of MazEF toxin-antitoxin module